MRIEWDNPGERYISYGVDRGTLYPKKLPVGKVVQTNLVQHASVPSVWHCWRPDTTVVARPGSGDGWNGQEYTRTTFVTGETPTAGLNTLAFQGSTFGISSLFMTIPVTPGLPYSGLVPVRSSIAQSLHLQAQGITSTSGGNPRNGPEVVLVPGQWTWLIFENYIPNHDVVGLRVDVDTADHPIPWTAGSTIDLGRPAVYQSAMLPPGGYFDGFTVDDLYTYEWTGTPNLSTSLRRERTDQCVAFNGITGFDEGASGSTSVLYRDGLVYMADVDASDFSGRLNALFYPDAFAECLGMPEVTDGLFVDNQKPKRFDFSYRTLVGSGIDDDIFRYQIHLVYNAMASVNTRNRKTMGQDVAPTEFGFDIVCTPVKLPGFRPSAHYVIDTRRMDDATIKQLEDILYGSATSVGRMPTPTELYDLMNFGASITVTVHQNITIGSAYPISIKTYTVRAANANAYALDEHHFKVDNANVVPAGAGEWTVSDGGNTTVIIE